MTTDYKNHSQADLESILLNVDRGRKPEVYQGVVDEITSRKANGLWSEKKKGQTLQSLNPSLEFVRKWTPRYLYLATLASTILLFISVKGAEFTFASLILVGIGFLWILSGVFAAYFFVRKPKWARPLAYAFFAPQILNILVKGYGFTALAGPSLSLQFLQIGDDTKLGFHFEMMRFYYQFNWNRAGLPELVMINFFALWLLFQANRATNQQSIEH